LIAADGGRLARHAALESRHLKDAALSVAKIVVGGVVSVASAEAAMPFRLTLSSGWPLTVKRRIATTVPPCVMRTIAKAVDFRSIPGIARASAGLARTIVRQPTIRR